MKQADPVFQHARRHMIIATRCGRFINFTRPLDQRSPRSYSFNRSLYSINAAAMYDGFRTVDFFLFTAHSAVALMNVLFAQCPNTNR
ncbi:ACYPI40782 protein [Aphis craccivora]|uniref:ACYPI40782 protein n=1 Tax=Aphis craccivora TaxID=307492 RepID=A0A6G0ZKS4_APHCR|nr:ACYPI40782 protein [Aphis craccivora]